MSESGKTCILDIDVQGAEQVKKANIAARYVFIAPPSFSELEKRLRGRQFFHIILTNAEGQKQKKQYKRD